MEFITFNVQLYSNVTWACSGLYDKKHQRAVSLARREVDPLVIGWSDSPQQKTYNAKNISVLQRHPENAKVEKITIYSVIWK